LNTDININTTALLLFQHNLRLHDNPALIAAAKHKHLICVYCFDDWQFKLQGGLKHCGLQRAKFIWQSLQELNTNLGAMGQTLYIVKGQLSLVIAEIQRQIPQIHIYVQSSTSLEEHSQQDALIKHYGGAITQGNTLLDIHHLPFTLNELPRVFTHFRQKVEQYWPQITPLATPLTLPPKARLSLSTVDTSPHAMDYHYDSRRAIEFIGGESQALMRLNDYMWQTKAIKTYKETRNELLGRDYSSKLSPWLATGCLSAKQIYQQVKQFEAKYGANDSTYWLIFELLWRDYFAFDAQLEFLTKPHHALIQTHEEFDVSIQAKFESWCLGNTGNSFVDANMRELLFTGFMSNRGRQNVASYLINELGLDWRMGAAWFEQQLIDYDPASNLGNWQYIAGIKSPNGPRRFNIASQTERYDSKGDYQRYWLNIADITSE
jgi:deoxyribodipyrimidine photo-lyase